jgi:hypothetical protein
MPYPGSGAALLQRDRAIDRNDTDAVEAALAASGDAHAFERLYRAHVGRVLSLVRRMLNDEDADEVTQDVFVRAWQKLGTYRGEAAFGTWLHRLAVNVILGRRQALGQRTSKPLSHGFRTVLDRYSCCTTLKGIGMRKSPTCWDWQSVPRNRSCIEPAWRCAGISTRKERRT